MSIDINTLLSVGTKIVAAIDATDVIKTQMRSCLERYNSMLETLRGSDSPDMFKTELQGLHDVYLEIEALHVKHTAGPEDPRWVRFLKKINRASQHESIQEALDHVGRKAYQLSADIAAKASIYNRNSLQRIEENGTKPTAVRTQMAIAGGLVAALFLAFMAVALAYLTTKSSTDVLKAVELTLHGVGPSEGGISDSTHLLVFGVFGALLVLYGVLMIGHRKAVFAMFRGVLPPTLPNIAAVPVGAPPEPRSYVQRSCVPEAVVGLINPGEILAPYTIVGMGGAGKSVIVSAVVRNPMIREYFRGGIFWVTAGKGAKNKLLSIFRDLARDLCSAPTDAPLGVPHLLDDLEQIKQHLAAVIATGTSPRLLVLDDVWEHEVVDALVPLGLKLLVTTRDRLVVKVPGRYLEVGDMTADEAQELLLKAS